MFPQPCVQSSCFVTLIVMSLHPDTCALRMAQVRSVKGSPSFIVGTHHTSDACRLPNASTQRTDRVQPSHGQHCQNHSLTRLFAVSWPQNASFTMYLPVPGHLADRSGPNSCLTPRLAFATTSLILLRLSHSWCFCHLGHQLVPVHLSDLWSEALATLSCKLGHIVHRSLRPLVTFHRE